MKLTKKQAIDFFRVAYWELARTGDKTKLEIKFVDMCDFLNQCPLCEYVYQEALMSIPYVERYEIGKTTYYCDKLCPINWPGSIMNICWGPWGLYTKWKKEEDIKIRKELAKQISELPERGDYEKI
jgi:hypothetical protein